MTDSLTSPAPAPSPSVSAPAPQGRLDQRPKVMFFSADYHDLRDRALRLSRAGYQPVTCLVAPPEHKELVAKQADHVVTSLEEAAEVMAAIMPAAVITAPLHRHVGEPIQFSLLSQLDNIIPRTTPHLIECVSGPLIDARDGRDSEEIRRRGVKLEDYLHAHVPLNETQVTR